MYKIWIYNYQKITKHITLDCPTRLPPLVPWASPPSHQPAHFSIQMGRCREMGEGLAKQNWLSSLKSESNLDKSTSQSISHIHKFIQISFTVKTKQPKPTASYCYAMKTHVHLEVFCGMNFIWHVVFTNSTNLYIYIYRCMIIRSVYIYNYAR